MDLSLVIETFKTSYLYKVFRILVLSSNNIEKKFS